MEKLGQSRPKRGRHESFSVFAKIMASIFLLEAAVMALFHVLGIAGPWSVVLDPILLAVLSTPVLCWLIVAPMHRAAERRRRLVIQLQESEELTRTITDSAPNAIILVDSTGAVRQWNTAAEKMFGYSKGEILGQVVHKVLVPARYRNQARRGFDQFARSGEGPAVGNVLELEALRRDGTEFPIELAISPIERDGRWWATAIVRDITQRKRTEEALRQSRRNLVEHNKRLDAVAARVKRLMQQVVTEQDFSVRFENPALVRCWEANDCDYRTCPSYGCEDNLRCWEVSGTFCRGKVQGRLAQKLKDCRKCEVYQHAWVDSVYALGETFNEMIAILEDRHNELADAVEAAKAADRVKSEFLANMSHEIRTPMTAILGFADILLEQLQDPEAIAAARTIRRNGEHLLEIINGILDLSKIEAGKIALEPADCSAVQIVADTASLMRVQADPRGVPLNVEYDGPIPETIRTDKTRLRQILINVVGNAIKFTEAGAVRLVTRLVKSPEREKGVRTLLPERPEGCFAQKGPDPNGTVKPKCIVVADLRRLKAAEGGGYFCEHGRGM